MAEINARTLMFNLGPEDAIDLTTSAKIARYTERKQLAYKLTDEGVLLLDGRGKKIHLKNGVVTLRNALDLHALPERIMTNVMREDVSLQGQRCCAIDSIGDNIVLTTDPNLTKQTNMLHVRKMALVDPQLLKSLHEHTTPQPPVDNILRDLDAEMTSILKSDAAVSEKVPLYNQLLLRYNEMTKMHAAIPTPVVVVKSNTVDNEPVAVMKSNTVDNEPAVQVLTIAHGDTLDTDMHIDDGYYDSPSALVRALNGEKGGRVKFSYDRVTQKVCVQMKGDTTFKLYGDLIDILGFRERHDQNGDPLDTPGEGRSVRSSKNVAAMSFPAETVVDLRRGFESLYVYSGIVEPRIVGDEIASLLRIVPITGRHGAMVTASFDHVQYIPVLSREFGTIETEIRDDTGRLVPFGCGKVTVTMHFRRRRHSSGLF